MSSWRVVGVCVAAATLAWAAPTAAGTPSEKRNVSETVRLLDVPYVPQSEALCGGAALAMVLRYWGKSGVLAEDFAALVEPGQAGIRTGALVKAVEACGWTALPLSGTPAEVENQLAQGRPIVALIRTGSGLYHYVVLVAWANGRVIVHDPNVGPFRVIREGEFETAWSGGQRWALLILPPRDTKEQSAPEPATTAPSPAAPDGCGALVEAGILLAQQGDTAEAEVKFLAAESLCPTSAAPIRERAGLRFRAEDWAGAGRLAEQAIALDPDDAHTWRLLAGSHFLAGDLEGALRAWNHLSEPRTDLTRIDGLTRTRFSAVAGQIHLPPGRLLTPHDFRRARRRLGEVPAQSEFRLSLNPLPEGNIQVNATVLERPLVFEGPWDVAGVGIRALTGREIKLDLASPTGNGELWSVGWRWWKNRPRVSLALTVPAAGGRPGIWRLDGFWERQTYAGRDPSVSSGTTPAEVIEEERRCTALSFSDWLGPDLHVKVGAALDEWAGRGAHLSLDGSVETRWARDRLALGVEAARWMSLENGAPFGTGGLSVKWCSTGLERCDAWQGLLGISGSTSEAPLALWSGAGTGNGRAPLLRAHPLLNGGVVQGRVFGRTLVHGTIERQSWPWELGPLRLGWALFIDGAKPWDTGRTGRVPWQVDGGTGLRLRSLGLKGQLRIDAARGFEDGNSAVSLAWQIR
jgi:hypothetical protein